MLNSAGIWYLEDSFIKYVGQTRTMQGFLTENMNLQWA